MEHLTSLFVYGTLKRGHSNSALLSGFVRSLEPATVRGLLFDVGYYPALVEGEGTVRGELVRLRPDGVEQLLWLLDRLEGYRPDDPTGSMYVRRVVEVTRQDGGRERAYAYVYNRDHALLSPLESGEWTGSMRVAARVKDAEQEAYEEHVQTFLDRVEGSREDDSMNEKEWTGK